MKTIGAKELRNHMDEVLDRVVSGEDIIVQHRFKEPVRLSAARTSKSSRRLGGLEAFDKAKKEPSPYDRDKSLKDLYRESVAQKYV